MRARLALERRRRRREMDLAPFAGQRDFLARRGFADAGRHRAHERGERQQVLAAEHLLDRRADDAGVDLEQARRRPS